VLTLDGTEPEPRGDETLDSGRVRFTAGHGALTVERLRTVRHDGGTEEITVRNDGDRAATAVLSVAVAADLAQVSDVKADEPPPPETPLRDGAVLTGPDGYEVRLSGPTSATLDLAPGGRFTTTLTVRAAPPRVPGFRPAAPQAPAPWARTPLSVRSADPRLDALVAQGVADLGALLLADETDLYCAAGSPWYLTLFGRDALWAARLALPLGQELAAGTLRTLARRQGSGHDGVTEEEPGKIPHELRPAYAPGRLPPVYYGTVDATALFVVTLAEAWRWGMPADQVEALLPAVEGALAWLGTFEEFVSYRGSAERLPNQGWKDSADGIQHRNGVNAAPPIALSEVQAYAYQAATLGADLLRAHGRDGEEHRRWAHGLADRFRARFWLDEGYPAIALDGTGAPVDGLASNAGHLLGTGLLDPEEEALVAGRIMELNSGWGLRTLTDAAAGYDPLSYHRGSVWPHDTAIAMLGLHRSGHREKAAELARGLIAAAPAFGHRLPELFGGQSRREHASPVPYPPSCRPQAWSAAVSPALVTVLFGLDAEAPAGHVTADPLEDFGPMTVTGVRAGEETLTFTTRTG
jgi:glycogen debranching enzyme